MNTDFVPKPLSDTRFSFIRNEKKQEKKTHFLLAWKFPKSKKKPPATDVGIGYSFNYRMLEHDWGRHLSRK